ncbi:MAG: biotin transporter BioY [Thaumarchaeota archaeon]|nr:biotin transporter BioY [Nitrososphaerota archaeon]
MYPTKKAFKTSGLAFSALFAALTGATAGIAIPIFVTPVPVTLQVFFIYLAGTLGGPIYGGLSMLIYVLLGAAGLPMFSGFRAGIPHLLGPTGGYLFAYPLAGFLIGVIAGKRNSNPRREWTKVAGGMLAGLAVIYASGIIWLSVYLNLSLLEGFLIGGAVFIPVDLVKLLVAAPIAVRLRRQLSFLPTTNAAVSE